MSLQKKDKGYLLQISSIPFYARKIFFLTIAGKSVGFAVEHIENGQKFGDSQKVLNFLRQI